MPFAITLVDLEIIILSWSKSGMERHIYIIDYRWNLKKQYKWTYLQNRNRLTDLENEFMVTGGKSGREGQTGNLRLTRTDREAWCTAVHGSQRVRHDWATKLNWTVQTTIFKIDKPQRGLPWWLSGKESTCQCRRHGFNPWVRKLPLEKEMATHASTLAWEIPWTEESFKLQSMVLQKNQTWLND